MASDEGGVKYIHIDERLQCIKVSNSAGEEISILAGDYTGDLSFIATISKVITAKDCSAKDSSKCPLYFWRLAVAPNVSSICSHCLNKKSTTLYNNKKKAKASALKNITNSLDDVNPFFKEHVQSQVEMATSKKKTYNSRYICSQFNY